MFTNVVDGVMCKPAKIVNLYRLAETIESVQISPGCDESVKLSIACTQMVTNKRLSSINYTLCSVKFAITTVKVYFNMLLIYCEFKIKQFMRCRLKVYAYCVWLLALIAGSKLKISLSE